MLNVISGSKSESSSSRSRSRTPLSRTTAGRRVLVMELMPLVRIARARIDCVAELEQEVAALLEALGDEPHAIVGQGRHSARSLGLKRAVSAVDILDILHFTESLYFL